MIKYTVTNDYDKLKKAFPPEEGNWRFLLELYKYAIFKTLKSTDVGGIFVCVDGYKLTTTKRLTQEQFLELNRVGIKLEEIDKNLEVKNNIISSLSDELNSIIRNKEFDKLSDKLYDMICNVKNW